jgi:hypothetical protein
MRPINGEEKASKKCQDEECIEQADVAIRVEEPKTGVKVAHGRLTVIL